MTADDWAVLAEDTRRLAIEAHKLRETLNKTIEKVDEACNEIDTVWRYASKVANTARLYETARHT